MRKHIWSVSILCLIASLSWSNLLAKDFVGKQRQFQLSTDELMAIAPDEFEAADPDQVAKVVFAKSPDEILAMLKAQGITPRITESTLYISGNKVRGDMDDPDMGKMSFILLPEKDMMYMIQWANNTYTKMSITEMEQMHARTEGMMESHLKNLPPEALEALKQYKGMGQETESGSAQLKNTGNSGSFNSIRCEEYRGDTGNTKIQAWVTDQHPELAKTFEYLIKSMPGDKNDKNDPDRMVVEQIPGHWPVITKTLEFNMMRGNADLNVEEMLEMNPQTVSPDKYKIPATLTEQKMSEPMKPKQ